MYKLIYGAELFHNFAYVTLEMSSTPWVQYALGPVRPGAVPVQ